MYELWGGSIRKEELYYYNASQHRESRCWLAFMILVSIT